MKKALLSFILLFNFLLGYSQNYQCLQSGVKHYFTNGNGYLRGIRIDSVKTFADSTIYYPFHTPRGKYMINSNLDSTGGSWLGKKVLQLSDGTFLFDNIWHDTVVIKTQANVGDSWIFYNDTTSLYYKADLVGIDTMTILGSVDSIKRILVTAHNPLGIVSSDPVDSFQIILSKNNGFVQVFDLYTFPYHAPDSAYTNGIDYYLDNLLGRSIYSFLPILYFSPLNNLTAEFKIISLINPTNQQLYDWNVGDVYEYSTCNGLEQWLTQFCDPVQAYYLDTIINKIVTISNTQYNYSGLVSNISAPVGGIMTGGTYTTNTNFGTYVYDTSYLIDTSLMPEEYKQRYIYYYFPEDTSYCLASPLYGFNYNQLNGNQYHTPFEGPFITILNKLGIGLVHSYRMSTDAAFLVNDKTLFYYSKSGSFCGTYGPLRVETSNLSTENKMQFFPNPARTELIIKTNYAQPYTITLLNVMGQTVQTISTSKPEETISVSYLPTGVYNVSIIDESGNRYNDKVVILH